jgi:hypothetical protein
MVLQLHLLFIQLFQIMKNIQELVEIQTDGRDEVYNDVVKTVQLPDSYTLKIYNSNMHFDIDTHEVLFMQSWATVDTHRPYTFFGDYYNEKDYRCHRSCSCCL